MKLTLHLAVLAGLALCSAAATAHAQRIAPTAVVRAHAAESRTTSLVVADAPRRPMPTWLKWGLVGAAAGAVVFPLSGSLASDSPSRSPAREMVLGAATGFVIVGGGIAAWQAICGPDSASRRAGACGR